MRRGLLTVAGLVVVLMLVVASCFAPRRSDNGQLSGRMSFWHTWNESQAEALDAVLTSFMELNPDVTIRQQRFSSPEEMREQYLNSVASGLGPDLILGPSSWLRDSTVAVPMDAVEDSISPTVLERTMPSALVSMRQDGQLMGVPLALDVAALYYNRRWVETPPATLDDLLAQAREGRLVLIPTNFYDAFWGIQAFGGRLFDDTGRAILERGGFANWLAWLKEAREVPGMILDNNRAALLNRFLSGEVAYYVGYAGELNTIRAALGTEMVGVATLPSGPVGSAGPFLSADGFYFSPVSSDNQRRLALALAQFISNTEQSGNLMRTVQMVPANARVRINPQLNPTVANFAAQTRSAVPIPDDPNMDMILSLGTDGFNRALEGDVPPAEVALETSNAINQALGLPLTVVSADACTSLGTIRLAHSWEGNKAEALQDLVARYDEICPLVIIDLELVPPDMFQARLAGEHLAGLRPTLGLASRSMLGPLIDRGLLLNLAPTTGSASLQKFRPVSLDVMRVQDALYGLPITLNVDALYYNRDKVDVPAALLDELRAQAGQGIPITLDTNFTKAFWGIGAFGGRLFDERWRVILDQGGMVEWLSWLRTSRDSFGITLTTDSDALLAQFLAGETAYYVGAPSELELLLEALGPDTLGVALLPSGPAGSSRPLVGAESFFFRASASQASMALAQEFAHYATDAESQTHLVQTANLLPTNATVDLNGNPWLALFAEQARSGMVMPSHANWSTVLRYGNQFYHAVLEEGEDAATAVAVITQQINEANGIDPLPEPSATPTLAAPITATAPLSDTQPLTASDSVTATLAPSETVPAATPVLP